MGSVCFLPFSLNSYCLVNEFMSIVFDTIRSLHLNECQSVEIIPLTQAMTWRRTIFVVSLPSMW